MIFQKWAEPLLEGLHHGVDQKGQHEADDEGLQHGGNPVQRRFQSFKAKDAEIKNDDAAGRKDHRQRNLPHPALKIVQPRVGIAYRDSAGAGFLDWPAFLRLCMYLFVFGTDVAQNTLSFPCLIRGSS